MCVSHMTEDPRARKPWPGEKAFTTEGLRNRRRNSDRQESRDYEYRQERHYSRDPYYDQYSTEPSYERAYDRDYDRRYERAYEPSRAYERGGEGGGGYYERSSYERYPTEKVSALDRYDLYPSASVPSKSALHHERDYYSSRDSYHHRALPDRRWEERADVYDQYADYYARPRADYHARGEEPYYAPPRVSDLPRHDPYERRPYDRYAAAYDRR